MSLKPRNKELRKQDIIIKQSMIKYIPEGEEATKKELCSNCQCKSKNCFKCRAAKIYIDMWIIETMSEKAKWN